MPNDASGAAGGGFPATRWSAVVAARSADPAERRRAFDRIVSVYWRPVYKYIRARWQKPGPDAQDLTQEFFARVIEKDFADTIRRAPVSGPSSGPASTR
jgi:RNA polymerase sigma-70 factor (ECF subfamily)